MILPGIEAPHVVTAADGATVTFNDTSFWPNYRIVKISGRHGLADLEDKRDAAYSRIGEVARRTHLRGKTEPWEVQVRGRTGPELRQGLSNLARVFAQTDECTIRIVAPSHVGYEAVEDYLFTARCIKYDPPDEWEASPYRETGGFERTAGIDFRLSDPRYFEDVLRSSVTDPYSPGIIPPFIPPITPVGTPPSVTVTNNGNAPAEPELLLTGPVTAPYIVNDTTGGRIEFPNLTIGTGQTLTVDFYERTAKVGDESVRQYIDWGATSWWDIGAQGLKIGANTIRFGGDSFGSAALLTVRHKHPVFG